MIVHVHADSSITLDDPDSFSAFAVQAPAEMDSRAIAACFGLDAESRDADHIWLCIARLRALGRAHGGPEWQRGCDGMLHFATSKGWVDEEKRMVRAHIER